MKIAIVGSGISGLACAYYLSKENEVYLFEKENYLGGHTNTIEVEINNQIIPVDTGFIVFNLVTYPNLIRFFDELNISYIESNMSFSVWNRIMNQYYAGTNLSTFFAKRSNFLKIKHYKFLKEIIRFNRLVQKTLNNGEYEIQTLGQFLEKKDFSYYFQENYILPMSSSIWSIPLNQAKEFPLKTLALFFKNHGLLSLNGHYQWYTVENGSYQYIKKIIENSKFQYFLGEPVLEVQRFYEKNSVFLRTTKRKDVFDLVILATHAPTSRKILKDITEEEDKILRNFNYHKNTAILHTDHKVMCPEKKIWSSWNYKIGENNQTATIYYLTKLQRWIREDIFVSINEFDKLDSNKIIKVIEYEHPIFDLNAIQNQSKLESLNHNGLVYFCGAYFKYGFHEDGFNSALKVIQLIKQKQQKEIKYV